MRSLLAFWTLTACGYLVPTDHKDDFFANLSRYQTYYDKREFDKALRSAQKARDLNPKSEEASLAVANSYLGLAGISLFTILRNIVSPNPDDSGEPDSGAIERLLSLTNAEVQELGTIDNSNPELPIIIPGCAAEVRNSVPRLLYINNAIAALCPLVKASIRLVSDSRHYCPQSIRAPDSDNTKFLWALAHLVEAAIFQSVILYNTTGGDKSNLELRAERIENLPTDSPADQARFVQELTLFSELANRIIPVGNECKPEFPETQSAAFLSDLQSVERALAAIISAPEDLLSPLSRSVDRLLESEAKPDGSDSEADIDTLRSNLNSTFSEPFATKLDELGSKLSSEQQTASCTAFDSLFPGGGSQVKRPNLCQDQS